MRLTRSLASWAMSTELHKLPKEATLIAKECILDTLGVAIAGSTTKVAKLVQEYAFQESCKPLSLIWGTARHTTPSTAALVNGTMSHALDYDETNYSAIGHPSSVIVPASLAVAEVVHSSGKEFLACFILGYEVMCKLGAAINPKTYPNGWWSTSVLGVVGAAVATSRLLGLTQNEIEWSLGLAVSQASGIRGNIGTLAKPFQAGRAAQSGVISAQLAKRGLTASNSIFEKSGRFLRLFGDEDQKNFIESLGKPFDLVDPGVAFKQYPTCSAAHSAVDAVIDLSREHDLAWENISSVFCEVTPLVMMSLIYDFPSTSDEARFSMPFCVAAALKERELPSWCFTEEYMCRPVIIESMKKVSMKVMPELSLGEGDFSLDAPESARVTIHSKDGRVYSKMVKNAKGGKENPLSLEELRNKFRSCTRSILPLENIKRCEDLVLEIEALDDINNLLELLRCPDNPS
jgi:2-methylcitrate dehydratase PrpD